MRVSAKADYAVRAMIELAGGTEESPVARERIAEAQDIPFRFLETILTELSYAGLARGRTGTEGGVSSPSLHGRAGRKNVVGSQS